MIDVLIVNLNCLDHTKNIIHDLRRQTFLEFSLTVIDQNSIEDGTVEYLNTLYVDDILTPTVIKNSFNVPLNAIWNEFVTNTSMPIVCLLNNDIRIPSNFMYDIVNILKNDNNIGAVMHPTNHPHYCKTKCNTEFKILERGKYRQGWDICMRTEAWTTIPSVLTLYCGDDFIFENMYSNGYDVVIATSSPMIHYLGQTRKSKFNTYIPERNPKKDIDNYRNMGYIHHMVPPKEYTVVDFSQSPVNFIEEC